MKKFTSLIIAVCLAFSLKAQMNMDSLRRVWDDVRLPDTVRLAALDEMAWEVRYNNPDSGIAYATRQYELAKQIGHKFWQAKACNTLGVVWLVKSDYAKAIEWHNQSLNLMRELGFTQSMATSYNNLGNIYTDQGDFVKALQHYEKALELVDSAHLGKKGLYYGNIGGVYLTKGLLPKALEQFQKSLKICEAINDEQGIALAANNIGIIYNITGDTMRALEYYAKSVEINKKTGDNQGLAETYSNISNIKKSQGDYAVAVDYGQKALALQQSLGNKQGIASVYASIGEIYLSKKDFPLALDNFQKAIKLGEEIGNKEKIATSYVNIANVYLGQGKYSQAENTAKKALKLNEELGIITNQREASKVLYEVYKTTGRNADALTYHEKIAALGDSIEATETNKKLDQMEFAKIMLADSLKKEEEKLQTKIVHEAEVHKKDTQRNTAIYIGVGVLILAGALFARLRYVRKARAAIQKEKDRSENLLLNILPAEIAEELKTHGKAEARDFERVSILFTDFKGFTNMSEKMSAKELVAEINHCFEAFDSIVHKYGVEKIKTIGDSYMAAGGLPISTPDSVKNTVLAALEMQTFIEEYRAQRELEKRPAFHMRAGVHTGPVAAGIVGKKKFQYDIWGDAVNTASRMESSGEVGKVNISEATYEYLKDEPGFSFESRGMVSAKGKGEMGMYFVSSNA